MLVYQTQRSSLFTQLILACPLKMQQDSKKWAKEQKPPAKRNTNADERFVSPP